MYRQSTDKAVTYTADDIVLFRESPFAAWMERLTLENPQHGIPPDLPATLQKDTQSTQAILIATLSVEGRNVVVIDSDMQELERNNATLAAMRNGADFIANGQLTVDTLSARTNFLMRTSGYSDLGAFLYIPCDMVSESSLNAAFRLSFVAELLHVLQGQLPPQMLIIREGADVVPLLTEDYIHYYRAVQQRFMQAMQGFRKHRMPDPAESSHFGRWSVCASEMFKQRARREQQTAEEPQTDDSAEEAFEMPQRSAAGGSAVPYVFHDGNDGVLQPSSGTAEINSPMTANLSRGELEDSGAKQNISSSSSGDYAPSYKPDLASLSWSGTVEATLSSVSADAALHNLEFIGSSGTQASVINPPKETSQFKRRRYDSIDSDRIDLDVDPLVDMDAVSTQRLSPLDTAESVQTDDAAESVLLARTDQYDAKTQSARDETAVTTRLFSSSLITSDEINDP